MEFIIFTLILFVIDCLLVGTVSYYLWDDGYKIRALFLPIILALILIFQYNFGGIELFAADLALLAISAGLSFLLFKFVII